MLCKLSPSKILKSLSEVACNYLISYHIVYQVNVLYINMKHVRDTVKSCTAINFHTIKIYQKDPKFLDRQVWVNRVVDQDQTAL